MSVAPGTECYIIDETSRCRSAIAYTILRLSPTHAIVRCAASADGPIHAVPLERVVARAAGGKRDACCAGDYAEGVEDVCDDASKRART